MPTLNIKDPEVHRMAHELARRNHTTATGAVRDALRDALAQTPDTRPSRQEIRARIKEIQRRVAESDETFLTDDDLYDPETGLPW
ncbi:type II toxin-antitoxin system VapB family antitoxin [Demetria terragena]|uniref:type II toxin-antitoxin system VapB family antitoxin n=1 Tax=Demetria terragena TaxID=63959 RepID=UPI00035FAA64|nr:type II toxin-antitoxin system VapB family antitoxin [Demetria terragena]